MPIYEYECTACEHEFETIQKFSDDPLKTCPECDADKLVKKISAAAFHLKGTGWYETDFKDKKTDDKKGDKSGDGDKAAGDSGGESSGDSSKADSTKSDSGKSDSGKSDSGKSSKSDDSDPAEPVLPAPRSQLQDTDDHTRDCGVGRPPRPIRIPTWRMMRDQTSPWGGGPGLL